MSQPSLELKPPFCAECGGNLPAHYGGCSKLLSSVQALLAKAKGEPETASEALERHCVAVTGVEPVWIVLDKTWHPGMAKPVVNCVNIWRGEDAERLATRNLAQVRALNGRAERTFCAVPFELPPEGDWK